MTKDDKAGIIFVIPSDFDVEARIFELNACMNDCADFHLACLRVATGELKREAIIKRADAIRELAHRHEVAVVLDDQFTLAAELGLDGVHLTDPDPKGLREARKLLGQDAIIGICAGASKHDGMVAGEIGVDYVSFGPLHSEGLDVETADPEIFEWWSEMIEIPVVAEGGLSLPILQNIKDHVDFVTFGREIFDASHPSTQLRALLGAL